jgi:hypothetical protein
MSARPRPKREQVATSDRVAWPHGTVAPIGAPPPFILFGGSNILGVVRKTRVQKVHRENEIAFLSAPAKAGEGDHWSSRSARTVVEGAVVPLPRLRGGGWS